MVSPSMFPMTSGMMSVRGRKRKVGRAFENESIIVHPPDVVKAPPVLSDLQYYAALIIGENINRVVVIIWKVCRPNLERGPICHPKFIIELGVLRESEAFL